MIGRGSGGPRIASTNKNHELINRFVVFTYIIRLNKKIEADTVAICI